MKTAKQKAAKSGTSRANSKPRSKRGAPAAKAAGKPKPRGPKSRRMSGRKPVGREQGAPGAAS